MSRTQKFLTHAFGATTVAALTFYSLKLWAGIFYPQKTAILAGALGAVGVPFLLNKGLTRVYRRYELLASEWNSIFGMIFFTNLVALPALYLGLFGVGGTIATKEAARRIGETTGFIHEVDEATLQALPESTTSLGVVWAPNVGTPERPRVILRTEKGELKAATLPEQGQVFDQAHQDFVVGPTETQKSRVMLAPVPESNRPTRIQVPYEGGTADFHLSKTLHHVRLHMK